MENHSGMQGSWTPKTPVKPNVAWPRSIYDGKGGLLAQAWGESEAYLSKYTSQDNEGQTFLTYPTSSSQRSTYPTINNNNNNWDGSQGNGNPSLVRNMGLFTENVDTQRRDFEGNNPHWSSQGRRSVASYGSNDTASVSYPMYNTCDLMSSWTKHGERGNGTVLEHNLSVNTMKFGDLLNMNELLTFQNNGDTTLNGSMFLADSVSQSEGSRLNNIPVFNNQEGLHGINQQIDGWYGQRVQNDDFPGQSWSARDPNSFPSNDHANKGSAFAPATPDFRQRLQSNVVADDTPSNINQGLNGRTMLQEHEVSAVTVNVHSQQNKNVSEPITDSPSCKDSVIVEKQNSEKGVSEAIDLNDTPQKKPRRRRYQPKVIKENKPRRTLKPKTPKPTETQDNKRKYARKNKTNAPTVPSGEETEPKSTETEPNSTQTVVKSCKKSLNFDLNGGLDGEPLASECQETENQSSHPANLSGVEEFMVKTSMTAYDLNFTLNQELKEYISLPEKENAAGDKTESSARKDSSKEQSPYSSPCASSSEGGKTRGSKRSPSFIEERTLVDVEIGTIPQSIPWKPNYTSSEIRHTEIPSQSFVPEVGKRKKTENISQEGKDRSHTQVELKTSKYYCNSTTVEINVVNNNNATFEGRTENRDQLMTTWADLLRLKKKSGTKGITRVQDLDQLTGKKDDGVNGPYPSHAILNGVRPCTEELPADINATPKPKRRSKKQDSVNNNWDIVPYNNILLAREKGYVRAVQWKKRRISIEKLAQLFQELDINREKCRNSRKRQSRTMVRYQGNKQEQNALVLYNKDGSIVPYNGPFNPGSKRRPRAKVDLDDETTRVWRLLLENIDNEGVNGTDEQKAKWWENERRVFRGRVDSFIARMRLVQGDRRFTPWKGSVLDSVIGVFLTQNVSDHLSSSAFMSMAAHFPLKTETSGSTLSEEAISGLFVEPEICIIEHEESITWNEKIVDQPSMDKKSRAIFYFERTEEKEVVNSSEASQTVICSRGDNANSHATETDTVNNDATSSPQSIISSQSSNNSPNQQTSGITNTFSESSSKFNCPDHSFMGLLKMAESNIHHRSNSQTLLHNHLEGMKHISECYQEAPGVSPSNYQLNLEAGFCFRDIHGIDILKVESRSSDMSRKDENSPTTEQINLTSEITDQERSPDSFPRTAHNTSLCLVLDGETMVVQSQMQKVREPLDTITSSSYAETVPTCKGINVPLSQKMVDDIECTGKLERTRSNSKEVKQTQEHHYASGTVSDVNNTDHNKTEMGKAGKGKKSESGWDSLRRDRTAGKGKKDAFDWDSLRRDAQVNGKKPERPAHTRDSLDWEAVLHADASEIADTIKERGMNNVLAGRIKDLLNRLVKDHGSIDMEWLRDIPPDKAKEYLLSYRGLGLKSVECVRLLTLHHLAFPVDTNVGRIAVRLGWVPLQPLPESLQLHLLEMYPILESIQQYLWPRLCKLDQKTLYELHYHMITFGKVFCTKRQPNCNACPLRGECRHFASAFASARFSLPGPEDKSIMPASGNTAQHVNLRASTNFLPSTSSWRSENPHLNSEGYCEAIVHGQSIPLSLPSPLNVHLERKSINSICEPIVEVPASPEQETQHEQALCDIEDTLYDDPNEIPTINLNMKEFSETLQNFMLQGTEMSKALVALKAEAASIPTPKLKNINHLRTEHHVYELPDTHPLLYGLEKREPDDPCSYLLAIWTPGETADSIDPPARRCCFDNPNMLCNEEACSYCNSQRETDSQIVRGTLLIPTRTAMRGSFPLNGTYFQVNEVFADHDSSLNPIAVPRHWLWNLARRTVYFGTSIPTIFKGLGTEDIQHCFWRGYVCVRGFDQKTRAPRPLMARLHFPASRLVRGAKRKA